MAESIPYVGILLVVLFVVDGQSATSEDSHCTYTFKVKAGDCSQTPGEDQLLKSSVMALQAQVSLQTEQLKNVVTLVNDVNEMRTENIKLAGKQKELTYENIKLAGKQKELTDENAKLRQKIATIEAGAVGRRNRSAVNLKQCSMRGLNYQGEYGLVFSCDFVKKRDDTVLRVVWNGDLRLIDTGPKVASTRRWFFTINGKECSEPRTIDTQLYVRDSANNIHRPAYVEGYCRGIAAGDVFVGWNVGDMVDAMPREQKHYNVGDSWTGWVATVRIIVEEVVVEDADTVIV